MRILLWYHHKEHLLSDSIITGSIIQQQDYKLSLSEVTVDKSISGYLICTVCFSCKYHTHMRCFVKTNEDYLLSICAQSHISVTFYDAYLWPTVSSFTVHWRRLSIVMHRALKKVQEGPTRSVCGFSQSDIVHVWCSRGFLKFKDISGIITVFPLNVSVPGLPLIRYPYCLFYPTVAYLCRSRPFFLTCTFTPHIISLHYT